MITPGAQRAKIQTYSGLLVDPLTLTPSDIRLEDIAHALGNICRFTGHCSRFYSVAEHSINVCMIAELLNILEASPRKIVEVKLAALLHDASEAYLNDVVRPLKQHPSSAFYLETEANLMDTIYMKYLGSVWLDPGSLVKQADDIMLGVEARDLMGLRAPGNYQAKEGKEWKPAPGAQRAWDETWTRYTKLIPDELYYRVSVAQAPPHKRNGERRAVLGDRVGLGSGSHGHGFGGVSREWLETVRGLLAARSPGVVFE